MGSFVPCSRCPVRILTTLRDCSSIGERRIDSRAIVVAIPAAQQFELRLHPRYDILHFRGVDTVAHLGGVGFKIVELPDVDVERGNQSEQRGVGKPGKFIRLLREEEGHGSSHFRTRTGGNPQLEVPGFPTIRHVGTGEGKVLGGQGECHRPALAGLKHDLLETL